MGETPISSVCLKFSLISARLTRRLPHGSFGFYLRTPRSLYVALRTRFCSASRSSISAAQSAQTCSPLRFVVTSLLIPTVAQDSHFILLPLSIGRLIATPYRF
jgi:hypothetical protein